MSVHKHLLAFGTFQATLVVLALGRDAGVLPQPWVDLAPAARWLLFAGAPALAFLAPRAVTQVERALAAVLVVASGLVAGVASHVLAQGGAARLEDVVGAVLAVVVVLALLDRLRRADVLGDLAPLSRAGFVTTGVVTALLGGVAFFGAVALLAALIMVLARVHAVDARRRVPGAVAAGFAANPLLPGLPLVVAGMMLERAGGSVHWPRAGILIALVALLVSALAPGLILYAARHRGGHVA